MGSYFLRRLGYMVIVLWLVSVLSFFIINLPPGSWIQNYAAQLEADGGVADQAELDFLRSRYGLDQPLYEQYIRWIVPLVTKGDFGQSFEWRQPVWPLIEERLFLTMVISITSIIFIYVVSVPIALYSATHQYSPGDYFFSFVGLIGLATPNFLIALVFMVVMLRVFNVTPGGLFSPEFLREPWSLAKFWDLMKHLPVPVIVVGTAGTAGLIRVLRAQLLDEFQKQYVITARAKGVKEWFLIVKYPLRMAFNPIISSIGGLLPAIVSGSAIVSIVLGLPTTGPLLLRALIAQDTYAAASMLMMLSILTVLGVFLSDLLLLWLDPRIRYERAN
ncbi:MAG: ABC transporter permease [Anaerolineae bacterium]|nr:ABC transporter permease [Anaerolineae bacterium]